MTLPGIDINEDLKLLVCKTAQRLFAPRSTRPRGEGTISGEITRFSVRCAERGVYSDLAFALQGTFSDPTT